MKLLHPPPPHTDAANSFFNPLNLSDYHLISPYNITPESHFKVMRIKEMVTGAWTFWFANKFSSSAPQEMYKEQYGEYACWSYGS